MIERIAMTENTQTPNGTDEGSQNHGNSGLLTMWNIGSIVAAILLTVVVRVRPGTREPAEAPSGVVSAADVSAAVVPVESS